MEYLINLGQAMSYVVIAMVILLSIYKVTSMETRTMALSLRQGGLFLGSALALYGVLHGSTRGYVVDLKLIVIYGVLSTLGVIVSLYINNKIILPRINNLFEIGKNNIAVGLSEFGTAVGTGLIMMGAMTGDGSFLTALVFFILGQIMLVVISYVYEYITPYNVVEAIKDNNISAGIMLGGVQIAMGILLSHSVSGDFVDWTNDLTAFGVSAISGVILIGLLFNKLIDKVFLPNIKVNEEIVEGNHESDIFLAAMVKISLAILVSSVVL
jgi:uncharacterized membrane protein YjfL (UPF0719 family)